MDTKSKKINTELLLEKYISTLIAMGEFVPAWIYEVDFVEEERIVNGYAYASAEHNCIYYKPEATEHALVHELDHLRSRHNNHVVGFDEEFERFVEFYFVGFRLGGFTGTFLEEGLNELSSRRVYLNMISNNVENRRKAFLEYRSKNYYNFEMFTSMGLCALLGLNVEELSKMKFSGDTLGQDTIKSIVADLTGRATFWNEMQDGLDSYEMAKRTIIGKKESEDFQKDSIKNYYSMAYKLLFVALENGKISKEEFKKRLRLFEFYTKRSAEYAPKMANMVFRAKQTAVELNRKVLSKNLLIIRQYANKHERFSHQESFVNLEMPEVYPIVTKSWADVLKDVIFKRKPEIAKVSSVIDEESDYGLS